MYRYHCPFQVHWFDNFCLLWNDWKPPSYWVILWEGKGVFPWKEEIDLKNDWNDKGLVMKSKWQFFPQNSQKFKYRL
jgi:hypothetical protein